MSKIAPSLTDYRQAPAIRAADQDIETHKPTELQLRRPHHHAARQAGAQRKDIQMDVETNFEPQPEDPLGTINPEQHDGYAALIEDGRRVLDIARLKNRNHKATWAITICISGAVHRGRTIIGVAAKMSFQSSEHIRVILAKGLAAGDWVKDEAGLYQLPQEPLTH